MTNDEVATALKTLKTARERLHGRALESLHEPLVLTGLEGSEP